MKTWSDLGEPPPPRDTAEYYKFYWDLEKEAHRKTAVEFAQYRANNPEPPL